MSTRALIGRRYRCADGITVMVRRTRGRYVWLEIFAGGTPAAWLTKLRLEVFELMFTPEGGAAHSPAPSLQPGCTCRVVHQDASSFTAELNLLCPIHGQRVRAG